MVQTTWSLFPQRELTYHDFYGEVYIHPYNSFLARVTKIRGALLYIKNLLCKTLIAMRRGHTMWRNTDHRWTICNKNACLYGVSPYSEDPYWCQTVSLMVKMHLEFCPEKVIESKDVPGMGLGTLASICIVVPISTLVSFETLDS